MFIEKRAEILTVCNTGQVRKRIHTQLLLKNVLGLHGLLFLVTWNFMYIYIYINYKEIVSYIESGRILIKRHRRKIHSSDF